MTQNGLYGQNGQNNNFKIGRNDQVDQICKKAPNGQKHQIDQIGKHDQNGKNGRHNQTSKINHNDQSS